LSLGAGLVSGRDFFFSLSYVWGGLLAVSFAMSRLSLRGVQLRRQRLTNRAQVGHLFQERITVSCSSRIPNLWLDVRDLSRLPGYRATALTGLGLLGPSDLLGHNASAVFAALHQGEQRDYIVRTVCTQRGRYGLGPTELRGGDPFGLFPRIEVVPVKQHVVVLPAVVPIHSFPIPSGRLPGGEALRRRTHQITPNASGVRDYEPGDSLKRIHWRSTAKRDRLIVKEFEFDPLADVWLLIDASDSRQYQLEHGALEKGAQAGNPLWADLSSIIQPSTEEYAVSIAASLAFHFMEQDRNVGLIAHGAARHAVQPERGQAQLFRLLESLAVLQAHGEHSLAEVVKIEGDLIPRGATVLIVTADTHSGVVQVVQDFKRLGKMPILIMLEAASFGGPTGGAHILEAARRQGTPGRLIHCGENLTSALSKPFTGMSAAEHR
jgi:uncharacterized protein (DUF58 family)